MYSEISSTSQNKTMIIPDNPPSNRTEEPEIQSLVAIFKLLIERGRRLRAEQSGLVGEIEKEKPALGEAGIDELPSTKSIDKGIRYDQL